MKSHFLIGAASSGCGKTTFTLGLLRALKNRSLRVQPFKCGPDYIDTRHHRMAAGCASVNLDRFMMSEAHIETLYRQYASTADVAVTEGVMGLFDGYKGMEGSSAEIARMLQIPVVLVVNAKSAAYSVAPMLYGFKHFNKEIRIAGVLFNWVASENHYSFLKRACEDVGVEALGYLPKCADIEIPSRHLGLSLEEDFCFDAFADRIAGWVEQQVDIDRLLEVASSAGAYGASGEKNCLYPCRKEDGGEKEEKGKEESEVKKEKKESAQASFFSGNPKSRRIAVARDAAFNFVYEENIRWLGRIGELTYFSPLQDCSLPEADLVYLPGGYPELYLPGLSGNTSLLRSIREYVEAGGKLLAECGGMMYLCREIVAADGKAYPMAGILDQSATMEAMKLKLGYRRLRYREDTLLGHEFHYSRILSQDKPLPSVAEACTARGERAETPLYRYKNVLAGYTHLYWADDTSNAWFIRYLNESAPSPSDEWVLPSQNEPGADAEAGV